MLFNSYEFIFAFLPITFFLYFYLTNKKLTGTSKGFLIFSSLYFYSYNNIRYLLLIIFSVLFNYAIGISFSKWESIIGNQNSRFYRKSILAFGIISNILFLGYFKYSNFFIQNINYAFNTNIDIFKLTFPLAISFYTFQQIAYLVDSFKKSIKERDFLNYILFVTFFPQLLAGPIVYYNELVPQFNNVKNKIINYKNISMGLFLFSMGLFKKIVIASIFSGWATYGYDVAKNLNVFEAWATSLSYTFQIYFDFSGYTDIAIGVALLFNIKLPINFNSPYKATSIQDFWRRWHITLSRFLRDYIYIPLGGNRKGNLRTYYNLMATFIIGGIWHGAGWNFILWGFLHGLALVINRIWKKLGFKLWSWLAWLITFNFINVTWVFFRAKTIDDATKVLSGMFRGELLFNLNYLEVIIILFGFIILLFFKNTMKFFNDQFDYSFNKVSIFVFCSFISILVIRLSNKSDFLYFKF